MSQKAKLPFVTLLLKISPSGATDFQQDKTFGISFTYPPPPLPPSPPSLSQSRSEKNLSEKTEKTDYSDLLIGLNKTKKIIYKHKLGKALKKYKRFVSQSKILNFVSMTRQVFFFSMNNFIFDGFFKLLSLYVDSCMWFIVFNIWIGTHGKYFAILLSSSWVTRLT